MDDLKYSKNTYSGGFMIFERAAIKATDIFAFDMLFLNSYSEMHQKVSRIIPQPTMKKFYQKNQGQVDEIANVSGSDIGARWSPFPALIAALDNMSS